MTTKSRRSGNYVSEWFGQRIYPEVRLLPAEVVNKSRGLCPFLSDVLGGETACVKSSNSQGVCTVNSGSNGKRQDWLVCPYRVIDSAIVRKACQIIFSLSVPVEPCSVVLLKEEGRLKSFQDRVAEAGSGYLFFQDKLGGEISVLGTSKSPEMAFDVTLVEVVRSASGQFKIGRYGILEIQTMDYHGTYKHAVGNLRDGLRLHQNEFPEALARNLESWAGEGVEGPNISNVFKRTFYQMLLKFKMAGEGSAAAGTVLALPQSVWDSWQPFLGAPQLEKEAEGIWKFKPLPDSPPDECLNAHICLFDLDDSAEQDISPVVIKSMIRVSPERMAHHAFTVVPETIMNAVQNQGSVISKIRARLEMWWPDIS